MVRGLPLLFSSFDFSLLFTLSIFCDHTPPAFTRDSLLLALQSVPYINLPPSSEEPPPRSLDISPVFFLPPSYVFDFTLVLTTFFFYAVFPSFPTSAVSFLSISLVPPLPCWRYTPLAIHTSGFSFAWLILHASPLFSCFLPHPLGTPDLISPFALFYALFFFASGD